MGIPADQIPIIEIRCTSCNKLLVKDSHAPHGTFEVKCPRCGTLNTVLERMPEQVVITDLSGVIIYANAAVERTTGYSRTEIIGSKPSLWGKQMPNKFYKAMWHCIKVKKQHHSSVVTNKHKDGTMYKARVRISPVLDTKGRIRFYVGIETIVNKNEQPLKSGSSSRSKKT